MLNQRQRTPLSCTQIFKQPRETTNRSSSGRRSSRKTVEESAALTKSLADKSATVEERIATYEKRLAELDMQCTDQLKKIESALPGATSAGLAHDFNERRKTFLSPHSRWQWVFIASVSAIVVLTGSGLIGFIFKDTPPTYDEMLVSWMSRLPVVGALVWLALHASRESALAKRLEEDYGYKAAIASCLVGFQKQMSELGEVSPDSPIVKLLDNTLKTIAAPPGRIYDKHKLTVSPISEVGEVGKVVVEAATTKLGINRVGLVGCVCPSSSANYLQDTNPNPRNNRIKISL